MILFVNDHSDYYTCDYYTYVYLQLAYYNMVRRHMTFHLHFTSYTLTWQNIIKIKRMYTSLLNIRVVVQYQGYIHYYLQRWNMCQRVTYFSIIKIFTNTNNSLIVLQDSHIASFHSLLKQIVFHVPMSELVSVLVYDKYFSGIDFFPGSYLCVKLLLSLHNSSIINSKSIYIDLKINN